MSRLETRLAHAGCAVDPTTGALTPPLHLATTFERDPDGSYPRDFIYSRTDNPTRRLLERTLAGLEGGAGGAAFASGMAAASAVLQSLDPGDHVLLSDDVYHGVRVLVRDVFGRWGLRFDRVDLTDLTAVDQAMRPETRLVWAESPSNPMLKIVDLERLAAAAHAHDARLLVDNTWATPLLTRPLERGADLVLHSVTKYLSGHSDVLGGAVVTRTGDALFDRIRTIQGEAGPVAAPFDCWLTLRGLRSLGARMRLHCANARRVAAFLQDHPRVARVHYPGLATHPGHAVARAQMADFGGMVSFEIDGEADDAVGVAARAAVFTRATSLGGTESLIEHRASIEAPPVQTPATLLRLSVGLEDADDLIEDLANALDF